MRQAKIITKAYIFAMVLFSATSFAQVKITDTSFKSEVDGPLEICMEEGFYGISIPINADLKKYDKITVSIHAKGEEDNDFEYRSYLWYDGTGDKRYNEYGYETFYPTSKGFKDKFEGKKAVELILYGNYKTKEYPILSNIKNCSELRHIGLLNREFKVVVIGSFADGSESYMDGNVLKSRTLYKVSKVFTESKVFTFSLNAAKKAEWDAEKKRIEDEKRLKEERKTRYSKIQEICLEVKVIPILGETQPKRPILEAYQILRKELIEKNDEETLKKVDEKLLNLGDNWKPLRKKLDKTKDPEEIQKIILEHQ